MHTRRDFLTTLGAALVASGCSRALGQPAAVVPMSRRLPQLGIQLYTERSLMSKDVEGTLAKIAEIGYNEVEFAGYFGRTPAQIRAVLDANHLTSPSTHTALPASDDAWARALDEAAAIGHQWIVIAYLEASERKSPGDWQRLATRFNTLAAKAQERGLRFAYHNHDFEFTRVGTGTGLDVLISQTDSRLVDFEMDLYWVVKAGADPLALIEQYPRRFPLMHVKDASAAPALSIVDVGRGTIDFARIFARADTSGMQHTYVENDEPVDAIESARTSYRYLTDLRY